MGGPNTMQPRHGAALIQLVALPLLAASLPAVNAGNTGRRQWLSYFGFSTVEGYDCLAFVGCIERNGCGNHRHSNDDPKHDLLFHNCLPEAPAVDHVADDYTEHNPPPPNQQLANHTVKPGNAYIEQAAPWAWSSIARKWLARRARMASWYQPWISRRSARAGSPADGVFADTGCDHEGRRGFDLEPPPRQLASRRLYIPKLISPHIDARRARKVFDKSWLPEPTRQVPRRPGSTQPAQPQ